MESFKIDSNTGEATSTIDDISALEFALYFIHKSIESNIPISVLKVTKLLYIFQGVSLATRGVPAFNDPIVAWKYGPAIPNVYHKFKHRGSAPFNMYTLAENKYDESLYGNFIKLLDYVWDNFKNWTDDKFVDFVCAKDTPWWEVYHYNYDDVIDNSLIHVYFAKFKKID